MIMTINKIMKISNLPHWINENFPGILMVCFLTFLCCGMIYIINNSDEFNKFKAGTHVNVYGYNVKGFVDKYENDGFVDVLVFDKNGKPSTLKVNPGLVHRIYGN